MSVFIESPPTLSTQPAGIHVTLQQWTRPVFRIPKSFMQDIHDRETYVKSDEVGQRQRAHGMIHTELHYPVDALSSRHPFMKGKDCFINHRHEYPVRNKPGRILAVECRLAQLLREGSSSIVSLIRSRHSANNLYELHYRHRVHEVHAYDFVRPSSRCTEFRYGD